MGVEGLSDYLLSSQSNLSKKKHDIAPGSFVLIDGSEYVKYLIREARGKNINFLPELGGDYEALDNILRDDINLLKCSGLNVTIYIDLTSCRGHNSMEDLPMPQFLIPQLEATLQLLGVPIAHTTGSASREMAKDCGQANVDGEKSMQEVVTFCYGNNM